MLDSFNKATMSWRRLGSKMHCVHCPPVFVYTLVPAILVSIFGEVTPRHCLVIALGETKATEVNIQKNQTWNPQGGRFLKTIPAAVLTTTVSAHLSVWTCYQGQEGGGGG
jgi:hypothetical protein